MHKNVNKEATGRKYFTVWRLGICLPDASRSRQIECHKVFLSLQWCVKDGISLKNVLNAISWQFSNALLSRDEAARFQMTKNPPKISFTWCDFTNFSKSISADSLDFRFRSLQVLYFQNVSKCQNAICITSQFHEFFNLIFCGVLSFETSVRWAGVQSAAIKFLNFLS